MRILYSFLLFFVFILLFSCQEKNHQKNNTETAELIPPETSYIIKTKNQKNLSKIAFTKAYLTPTDYKFIEKLPLPERFTLNIIQNNTKLKGFVIVADSVPTDAILNSKIVDYQELKFISKK